MKLQSLKLLGIPIIERQWISTGTTANPVERATEALGGGATQSGISINTNVAVTISAVWRAVNVVSGTLAFLPLQVFLRNDDESRSYQRRHPIQKLINVPNQVQTSYAFRQTMHACRMLYGNAYALIDRSLDGRPVSLHFIHPDFVEPYVNADKIIMYRVAGINGDVPGKNMIHLQGLSTDGIKGRSIIAAQRESLGLTKAAEVFGARFFGSGTNMDGVIEVPGELGDTAYNNMKTSWNERYSGINNSHSTPILEGGAVYKRIGIPPEDAQFLETRQFQISEIARWYGVQPHILFDLSKSTNNNIEHQGMEFVRYTLAPEIAMWENELNHKLFTVSEKETHYVEFNLNALLRGDSKTRSEYYKGMFSVGAMDPNEIRKLENMPAYEGGSRKYVQAGFVPTDLIENVYKKDINPNTPIEDEEGNSAT